MSSNHRNGGGALLLALLLVLSPVFAVGQGIVTGTISGTVVDQQGAVVSGAKITAKDPATNREFSTQSDAAGAYALRGLPVGSYNVTIEAAGFSRSQIGAVTVFTGRETAMGAQTLQVGAETETVDVQGSAPLVESTSAQISTSFDNKKVTDLPIAGGGFDVLALLVPGVADSGDVGFTNTNGADFAANGQRGRSNNFQIDGQSNNDNSVAGPQYFMGNQDVLAEFQIITNNYSAEFGRNMGSVVNYVTKSGTNNFHGTAFWFHNNVATASFTNEEKNPAFGKCVAGQNPDPDGVPFSGDECSVPAKADYRQNRFGATLGGPVVADKLWFFGSFYDNRLHGAGANSTSTALSPTPAGLAQLQAAFPGNPAVDALVNQGPYSVATGNPTAANVQMLDVTGPGGVMVPVEFGLVTRTPPSTTSNREYTGRIDWQLSEKDRVFGRYLFQGGNFAIPSGVVTDNNVAAGAWVDVPGRTHQIGLDWSRSWTSRFINQVRWSYSRANIGFEGGSYGVDCLTVNILNCPSRIAFNDNNLAFGIQNNLPQSRLVNNTQFQDNASWVIGRHTLKFGGEYSRQRSPNIFLPNINATYTYNSFDAFLQDTPAGVNVAEGVQGLTFKEQDMAFYFQDDWRILDNLTLNLGIRWERFEQAMNDLNALTVARESDPTQAFWDPTLPLDAKTTPLIPQDNNNWGPNIGFAWTPRIWEGLFGRDKTVIRGGYRIAYDPAFYNIFLNVQTSAPVVNAATVLAPLPAGGVVTGQSVRDAGVFALAPRGGDPRFRNQTTVSPDFHNPYTQQWSLGIQRQITSKIAGEVRYVGNHTVGNFATLNGNPRLVGGLQTNFPDLVPAGVTPCMDAAAPGFGRVNCDRRIVRERSNQAFSIYHGMQSRLDLQNWRGLTAGMNYTWSKAIDNVSEIFATLGGGNTNGISQNPFDVTVAERGVAGTSFPHVFTTYWIYELPWFRNQEGIVGHVLGGWQVNGAWRFQSGQAFNPAQLALGGGGFGSSSCDLQYEQAFNGFISGCRPFLGNPDAPLDSMAILFGGVWYDAVAFWNDPAFDGSAAFEVDPNAVHWIYNNDEAAAFFGTPFGVPRNFLRGQSLNNVDMGIYKNTKVTEKLTIQFQANVFNVFNRQFYLAGGVPFNIFPEAGGATLDGSFQGAFMNNNFSPSNNRFVEFGLRFIF